MATKIGVSVFWPSFSGLTGESIMPCRRPCNRSSWAPAGHDCGQHRPLWRSPPMMRFLRQHILWA
jgi:hypothetical protein